jgi:hypothetical protein
MKKFTIVYNNVYYLGGIKNKHMIVEWVDGKDMHDAMYNHYQSLYDEGVEVEDVICFEGELNYKTPEEIREVAA